MSHQVQITAVCVGGGDSECCRVGYLMVPAHDHSSVATTRAHTLRLGMLPGRSYVLSADSMRTTEGSSCWCWLGYALVVGAEPPCLQADVLVRILCKRLLRILHIKFCPVCTSQSTVCRDPTSGLDGCGPV